MSQDLQLSKHVLIVEDEKKLADVLQDYLRQSDYQTDCLYRGDQVIHWLSTHHTDLIVLDLMLPGLDGMQICQEIRRSSTVPILMATAKVAESERLVGWKNGADDYVCKPYSMREMVARIDAKLRRLDLFLEQASPLNSTFKVDLAKMEILVNDTLLELTPVEFRLLNHFICHPSIVFSRDDLLNVIYNDYRLVSTRTIDSHIKNVRKKLQPMFTDDEPIKSIYSVGYKFDPK